MLEKLTAVSKTIQRLAKAGEDPAGLVEALDAACAGLSDLSAAIKESGAVPPDAAQTLAQWAEALEQLSCTYPTEEGAEEAATENAPEAEGGAAGADAGAAGADATKQVQATKEMGPDEFLAYAVTELEACAAQPNVQKRALRLTCLSKAVRVAKEAFIDSQSQKATVTVWWEPGVTNLKDQTESTVKPPVDQATGSSFTATNPAEVMKRLHDVQVPVSKSGAQPVAWPQDMNGRSASTTW